MYIWRIAKLKQQLIARPLSDKEVLPYLVAYATLTTATMMLPHTIKGVGDAVSAALSVLATAFGTIYVYRQNGGATGSQFLQRYIAVGWVIAVRYMVLVTLATIVLFMVLTGVKAESTTEGWLYALYVLAVTVLVYWRIGYHVKQIADQARAA